MSNGLGVPKPVDRSTFQAALDNFARSGESSHKRRGRDCSRPPAPPDGRGGCCNAAYPVTLLDAFEGRQMLIAYYFMWHAGHPASEQCEGCTFFTSQVRELSYMHARNVTYATFAQGPYEESIRYHDFMGWNEMPWYSAPRTRSPLSWPDAGWA